MSCSHSIPPRTVPTTWERSVNSGGRSVLNLWKEEKLVEEEEVEGVEACGGLETMCVKHQARMEIVLNKWRLALLVLKPG